MPKIKTITLDPADVDDDGICASQTPSGAGALTLNGALGTTLDYARQIGIYSASNLSGRTFVVTGTDSHGITISESITGPNNGTVESSRYFKTISSITISGAAGGALIVGTVDELVSPIYSMNRQGSIEYGLLATVTGTIDYTVQVTGQDIQSLTDADSLRWLSHDTLVAKTANSTGNIDKAITGMRLKINSYSSGADVTLDVVPNNCCSD